MSKLYNLYRVLPLVAMLLVAACGCGSAAGAVNPAGADSATPVAMARKIEFVQPNIIPETSLDLFLSIYGDDNGLLDIEGKADIAIWESQDSAANKSAPVQQWQGIKINTGSYEAGLGNWLSLPYAEFVPKPEQTGYIIITFTPTGGTAVTYEGTILLLRGSCCA